PPLIQSARKAAAGEILPIDDIRSTARYRGAVAGNLVADFLEQLAARGVPNKNTRNFVEQWNAMPSVQAAGNILPCCGSEAWAFGMAARRPIRDEATLLAVSDQVWNGLSESDWLEAFRSHPRIGESRSPVSGTAQSAAWSGEEQRKVGGAAEEVKVALAEGNRAYEKRFKRIFIVCVTGKSAPEILAILQRRLQNDESTELREAAEEQRQIARLRLKKWLNS
ncbi:MAG: 2-oxo-4-hydroxy-4-carboxy-5-ureidoimidazoline decarboxylase, partial [Candidatus Acidiferrum sp.]